MTLLLSVAGSVVALAFAMWSVWFIAGAPLYRSKR